MGKPRKLWSQLSPDYRKRLKGRGITPQKYNAGKADLKAARGHATTPERPTQAFRDSDIYEQYLVRRYKRLGPASVPDDLAQEIEQRETRDAIIADKYGPTEVPQERWGYPPGYMVIYPPRGGRNPDLRTRVHIHHNDGRDQPDEWYDILPSQATEAILMARAAGYAADYYAAGRAA